MSASMAAIHTSAEQRLRVAIAEADQVISPFQYYTHKGERILCLDQSSQSISARCYVHLDAKSRLLSRLDLGTASSAESLDWAALQQEMDAEPADFSQLMHEMHVSVAAGTLYSTDQLQQLVKVGRGEPILIVGCGRSGTTLLLSILGAHPDIFAFSDETYAFYPFPFRLSAIQEELSAHADQPWTRWCEKTPKHVRAIPEIVAAFNGRVKIIHLVRDGRDVVTSHHPNAAERYYISPERWVADVGAGWENRQHTLLMRYEDLVQQPRESLTVMCSYLGLDFDERLLSFEQHSQVKENKAWEGRQVSSFKDDSLARWQKPEHSNRVVEFMETPGATELMQQLDYL